MTTSDPPGNLWEGDVIERFWRSFVGRLRESLWPFSEYTNGSN